MRKRQFFCCFLFLQVKKTVFHLSILDSSLWSLSELHRKQTNKQTNTMLWHCTVSVCHICSCQGASDGLLLLKRHSLAVRLFGLPHCHLRSMGSCTSHQTHRTSAQITLLVLVNGSKKEWDTSLSRNELFDLQSFHYTTPQQEHMLSFFFFSKIYWDFLILINQEEPLWY